MFVENKLRKGHVLVPFRCVLASQGGFRYPRKKERKEMLPRIDQPCPLANFFQSYQLQLRQRYTPYLRQSEILT